VCNSLIKTAEDVVMLVVFSRMMRKKKNNNQESKDGFSKQDTDTVQEIIYHSDHEKTASSQGTKYASEDSKRKNRNGAMWEEGHVLCLQRVLAK